MDKDSSLAGENIGKTIRKFRKRNGLTQEGLARLSGVSYTTYTKVENGAIKNPSFQTIAAIGKALKVSLDEFTS